ncbi:MAG: glyoxalase [Robiginitomaculum sp.]|nr:MAG: glyoxalase [Robiginitomaculum sp.]
MILRYTILYVENVPATLAFFNQAFGVETEFLTESHDYGNLKTGDMKLAFSSVSLMKSLGKNPSPADADAPTFEIAFETDDVAAAFQRAKNAGAKVIQEPRDEPWGQTTAYVSDINGYLVEICSAVAGA